MVPQRAFQKWSLLYQYFLQKKDMIMPVIVDEILTVMVVCFMNTGWEFMKVRLQQPKGLSIDQ